MNKLDKNYNVVVSTGLFFIFFFFGSDYLELPNWLRFSLSGIGGVIGYFIGVFLKKVSANAKIVVCVLLVSLIVAAIAYQYVGKTRYSQEMLYGSWVTDDSEQLIIKFKITRDELFISRSSDQLEKVYSYYLRNDSLKVYSDNEIVFSWKLIIPDEKKSILDDGGETLALTRIGN